MSTPWGKDCAHYQTCSPSLVHGSSGSGETYTLRGPADGLSRNYTATQSVSKPKYSCTRAHSRIEGVLGEIVDIAGHRESREAQEGERVPHCGRKGCVKRG